MCLRERPRSLGAVAHGVEDFGGDDELFAAGLELAQELAGDALALAEGVDVGGVEEVDAGFDGALDDGARFIFFQHPLAPLFGAVGHHAEAERRDADSGVAEVDDGHGVVPVGAFRSWQIGRSIRPDGRGVNRVRLDSKLIGVAGYRKIVHARRQPQTLWS